MADTFESNSPGARFRLAWPKNGRCRWPAPSMLIRRLATLPASAPCICPGRRGSQLARHTRPRHQHHGRLLTMFGGLPMWSTFRCWSTSTPAGRSVQHRRTIRSMIKAGSAAVHIEDQVSAKRCGHSRQGTGATDEMADRIKAAVDARTDSQFVIMAAPMPWPTRDSQPRSAARRRMLRRRRHDFC